MNKPSVGTIRSRLTAKILFAKIYSTLSILNILIQISPPSKKTLEELLIVLEDLKFRLKEE